MPGDIHPPEMTCRLTIGLQKMCPEGERKCTFTVEATDQGQPPLSGRTTVIVHIVGGDESSGRAPNGTEAKEAANRAKTDGAQGRIRIRYSLVPLSPG